MVSAMCSTHMLCLDLMENFKDLTVGSFDESYDHSGHFGPKLNKVIAGVIGQFLQKNKI